MLAWNLKPTHYEIKRGAHALFFSQSDARILTFF
jgi:hypothetical protein